MGLLGWSRGDLTRSERTPGFTDPKPPDRYGRRRKPRQAPKPGPPPPKTPGAENTGRPTRRVIVEDRRAEG